MLRDGCRSMGSSCLKRHGGAGFFRFERLARTRSRLLVSGIHWGFFPKGEDFAELRLRGLGWAGAAHRPAHRWNRWDSIGNRRAALEGGREVFRELIEAIGLKRKGL